MKKIMIFAAVAAMFSLASCQKDEFVANNEVKGSPVFTAVINSESTKTTVAIDGNKGKISWEQTDEITITDSSTPTPKTAVYKVKSIDETTRKATFEIKSGETALGAGPYTATYGVAQPTYQTYSASAPASAKLYMEAPSTATKEFVFDVKCGLMKLNLSKDGETITDIAVTGTPTGGTKKTYTMYCPGGVDISSGKDFFIALPAGSYDKIEVYKHDATNGFMVCSLIPSTSIAISANHIKPVNASDSKIVFSECQNLPGVFSVSNDDGTTIKQIRFSKGNLTCDISGATPDWKFYEHQYDCATGYDATLISLFTWGYDAEKSIDPDGTSYVEGHTTDGDPFDSTEDWGTQIGDDSTWRTLTSAEWTYLLNTRTSSTVNGTSNARYLKCKVNDGTKDVYGLMIFPDTFTWPTDVTAPTASYINKNNVKWTSVPGYTSSEFEALEKAGVVFLPAAGSRSSSNVTTVGSYGNYWSSTACSPYNAYYLKFGDNKVDPASDSNRGNGRSVRLVSVVH